MSQYYGQVQDLADLVTRRNRRGRGGRREKPFQFLLDSRLFRLLCDPAQTAALDSFHASLARHRLAPEGRLPDLEMTPLAILGALGVEPPELPAISIPNTTATLQAFELGILLLQTIKEQFGKFPELEPARLRRRVDELRRAAHPAAHELFDLCLTRFVSREAFAEDIVTQLTFDALFRFRFPEERREEMTQVLSSFLLNNETKVSGMSKVRLLKAFWDRSYERLLRKHPQARGEIQAADQEMKNRTFKDFLGWEVIHHSVLGYTRKRVCPVIAFTSQPEARLKTRCRVHKTALHAFLTQIPREERATDLRPRIQAWTPGWLVPCRADGTFEEPMSTGELPIF
jgi:hypothetical protein